MSNIAWGYGAPTGLQPADFPQLAECADACAARRHLGAALGAAPRSCEVLNIWSIAGRSLRAVYRAGDDVVSVEFLRRGQSEARHRAARAAASDPAAVLHLATWEAVAWRLPEDPGGLPIAELVARSAALAGGAGAGEARLLSYLPGERCAVRCGAVVGKLQRAPGLAEGHARLRRLWDAPGRRLPMPEPLAADEYLGARWERLAPGRRLEELPGEGPSDGLLAAVADGLAWLHAARLPGLPAQGPAQILRRIERKVLPRVRAALPDLAPAADALYAELVAAAAAMPARPAATLHGDLHTANILVDGDAPIFIDLDSLAAGDPAYDLAMLGSRMILGALRRGAPPPQAAAALPDIYAAAGGQPVPPAVYAWHLAALLLGRQVKTCLRNLAPQSDSIAPELLAIARSALAAYSGGRNA